MTPALQTALRREADTSSFRREGFLAPVPVFTPAQCALIRGHLRFGRRPTPQVWDKERGAADRFIYDLAARPVLLGLLRPLLGNDILLWGASVQARKPGQIHPWHNDIESFAEGFVTIWIGIANTSRESGLKLISRSHLNGKMIQQVQHEKARRRGQASDEEVLAWARELDPDAASVQPPVKDGDAVVFDGRLWHGSNNERREGRRVALLLQYAAADAPVHMFDPDHLEWPCRVLAEPRPPAVAVSGRGDPAVNRLVRAPRPAGPKRPPVTTRVEALALPLAGDPVKGWRPHPLFTGATSSLHLMTCHASVLSPRRTPHPPHAHVEEEILIALDGEAELLVGDGRTPQTSQKVRLRPGRFVYYPAYQHHTIHNPQDTPITYLMFKWQGRPREAEQTVGTALVPFGGKVVPPGPKPFRTLPLFQHPTAYLTKLHAHLTELQSGAGYAPHADPYDVAIIVLAGKVETLGRVVEPHGVIYYAAGQPHGMKNVGKETARYLVFEFHARGRGGGGLSTTAGAVHAGAGR